MEPVAILAVVAVVAMTLSRSGPRHDKQMACGGRASTGTLVSGLIIASIGLVLLLDRFGVMNSEILWRLWPMIFVVIGITRLVDASGSSDQVWGGFLISMGALLTLHEFGFIQFGFRQLWPLFLIAGGLLLAWHSNEIREGRKGLSMPPQFTANPNGLHMLAVFGGIERKVLGKLVQGGNVTALFGGFKIDLSRADMEGSDAVIYVNAVFGGGEIIAPESWKVSVEGAGIFGGYVDKTRYVPPQDGTTKTLHLRGAAVFGGIEVKTW